MTAPADGYVTAEILDRIIAALPDDTVLVGGQALAVWIDWYDIDMSKSLLVAAVSQDADLLGGIPALDSILKAVNNSKQVYRNTGKEVTALVGEICIPVSPHEVVMVDVIHRLAGMDAGKVRALAVRVQIGNNSIKVMHPLHVLESRINNLFLLKSKRTDEGYEQARLALEVAGAHILDQVRQSSRPEGDGERAARMSMRAVEHVVKIATSSAGRFAAKDERIDFLSALKVDEFDNEAFRTLRWPQIRQLLGR